MRLQALVIATAGLLTAASAADDDAAKKDRDRLKGSWSVVTAESDGQKLPEPNAKTVKVTFADDKMLVKEGDSTKTATFQLDAGKKPRTIDITPTEGNEKGKTMRGIYELDGDDLKLCVSRPGKDQRPTEFAAKAESERLLLVLKRDKP